jgi:hypothetical protein
MPRKKKTTKLKEEAPLEQDTLPESPAPGTGEAEADRVVAEGSKGPKKKEKKAPAEAERDDAGQIVIVRRDTERRAFSSRDLEVCPFCRTEKKESEIGPCMPWKPHGGMAGIRVRERACHECVKRAGGSIVPSDGARKPAPPPEEDPGDNPTAKGPKNPFGSDGGGKSMEERVLGTLSASDR